MVKFALALLGAVLVYVWLSPEPVGLRTDVEALGAHLERLECASDPTCLR